jgi:hypothetical protein
MKIGRTTLLLFLVPVLLVALLAALINFWSLHSLKQQHKQFSAEQSRDVAMLTEAARLSGEMAEIDTRVEKALAEAVDSKLDEAQLYRIHTEVVNKLAGLSKRVDALSQAGHVMEISPQDAQALREHFRAYRNFVVMATDIVAIDPSTARRHIHDAEKQFIVFSQHAYRLSAKLAEHTNEANSAASRAFEEFFNQVLLIGLLGMAFMLLLSVLSARLLTRKIGVVVEALNTLSDKGASGGTEASVALPEVERMYFAASDGRRRPGLPQRACRAQPRRAKAARQRGAVTHRAGRTGRKQCQPRGQGAGAHQRIDAKGADHRAGIRCDHPDRLGQEHRRMQ